MDILKRHSMTTIDSEKIELLKKIKWHHTIELGFYTTNGSNSLEFERENCKAIPEDLSGLSVLDVGAWDGYYSFVAEKRGAKRVLAIDIYQGSCSPDGFFLAKEILGSKVEHRELDVTELEKLDGEKFDVILFMGVYYHLKDPVLAIRKIHDALNDRGLLVFGGKMLAGRKPRLYEYKEGEYKQDATTFCAATIPWVIRTCSDIGFDNFKVVYCCWKQQLWKRFIARICWELGINANLFGYVGLVTMRKMSRKVLK
jgi:tRNA (mo5U34)-methyltransferase